MIFPKSEKTSGPVKIHWMDGGIMPPRPDELDPSESFIPEANSGGGMIFMGTKGKMMAGCYSDRARLLPVSRMDEVTVPQKYKRVPNGANGHYAQWVEACLAGYGNMEVSSPFEVAALVTENMLVANLAIRGYNIPREVAATDNRKAHTIYPSRGINMQWDAANMKVTNVDEINQYVKRHPGN
jgi:hypothetical protein